MLSPYRRENLGCPVDFPWTNPLINPWTHNFGSFFVMFYHILVVSSLVLCPFVLFPQAAANWWACPFLQEMDLVPLWFRRCLPVVSRLFTSFLRKGILFHPADPSFVLVSHSFFVPRPLSKEILFPPSWFSVLEPSFPSVSHVFLTCPPLHVIRRQWRVSHFSPA